MYLIGLTGGIASGKSTVSRMLAGLGAVIIDADALARDVVRPGQPAWMDIFGRFGEEILLPDRTLNRSKLSEQIFGHPEEKAWLDQTTHPRIEAAALAEIASCKKRGAEIVVLDVPLLLEAGWQRYVNETWVVAVEAKAQLGRLTRRNQLSDEEALRRIDSQMPMEEKIRRADYVIDNNGAMFETEEQVLSRWNFLKKKANESDLYAPQ